MSIGTKVVVGFDASAVRSGMGGLKGLFSGAMRGMRQVGIGAARQIGAGATDLLGRILMAIPEGIKETMDWAGNMNDMSKQTGLAVSKLILLEEALRNSGAEVADTSRLISTFAENLGEAMRETGPARDALNKLGFFAEDFANVPIDKAFEKVGKAASNMSWGVGELESAMGDLFGAKMGLKQMRFFKDIQGNMVEAEKNVGRFARRMDVSAPIYDQMSDNLGRFQMRWRETMAIIVDELVGMFGKDWIDQMFDFLDPEKIRMTITWLREELANLFTGDGFDKMLRGMGRAIGEGIRESFTTITPGSMIKGMFGGGPTAATSGKGEEVGSRIDRSNALLQKIVEKKGGWA